MGHYESPEAAYWAIFERFNAKDAAGWAGTNSYPHVRVSTASSTGNSGSVFHPLTSARRYPTFDDYATTTQGLGWQRFEESGWVRTQGIDPRRVFETENQVLLAGGWTRLRADDSPIISNRVLYTLTRLESGWGIQARFGVDSFIAGEDRSHQESAALAAAGRATTALAVGNLGEISQCFQFPLTVVTGLGRVVTPCDAEALLAFFTDWKKPRPPFRSAVKVIAAGGTGVLVVQSVIWGDEEMNQGVLVGQGDDGWNVKAIVALP